MRLFHWTLSKKLIAAFIMIIMVLMLFIIYEGANFNSLLTQYNLALENNMKLGEFFSSVTRMQQYMRNSLVENNNDQFKQEYLNCLQKVTELKTYIIDPLSFGKLTDLEKMLQTYNDQAEQVVKYYSDKKIDQANKSLEEAAEINQLILDRYGYYAAVLNKATEDRRIALLQMQRTQNLIDMMIIAGLVVFCVIFAGVFTSNVTNPVKKLAENAAQISKGNFNIPKVETKSRDEVSILSDVFYKMVQSIKFYIREIEQKAELQEKSLRNEALLKQTQLNALQSKINPHFLFNTLNMIKQTAYIENAKETRVMLETTAQLLRFYIDKAGIPVPLTEELESVKNYVYIQEKRMGSRIGIRLDIDGDFGDIYVPSPIVQPLLENAIMHGLDDCIRNGEIFVRAFRQGECVKISVADNGKGMSAQVIDQVLSKKHVNQSKSIGMVNVLQRMELFYGQEGLMEILSGPGGGTNVTLTLLRKPEGRERNDV